MIDLWLAPILAAIAVAISCGPLGCFIIWRRMAYFGDTLAHSALMGVAFGLLFEVDTTLAVMLSSIVLAIALVLLQKQKNTATDTLLGILAHGALAISLIIISLTAGPAMDLNAWLFGDILTVNWQDLLKIAIGCAVSTGLIIYLWRPLLAITVHEDLAQVEGLPIARLKLLLMIAIALLVAITLKIVGALLVTALLIIPAATARLWSKTPVTMAGNASLIGLICAVSGFALSWWLDIPTGPAIISVALLLFIIGQIGGRRSL